MNKLNSNYIAAKYYYNRLAIGFFSSFVLEEYVKTGLKLKRPTLDIGCGNGIFCKMLKEIKILDSVDISLDYSLDSLRKFKKDDSQNILCGDAKSLPLKNQHFASIIANGVLCAISIGNNSSLNLILSGIYDTLIENGLFVMSVPTNIFNDNLLIPKILRFLRMNLLSEQYIKWIEKELPHYQVFSIDDWICELKKAQFVIEKVHYYFSPYQGILWNLFTIPILSFWFKVLKLADIKLVTNAAIYFLEIFFRTLNKNNISSKNEIEKAGYVLIIAKK